MHAHHWTVSLVGLVVSWCGFARATLTPQFVPVAGLGTGAPYPAAALAADPNLAGYATYDLKVTVNAGDRWSVATIETSTNSTASGVGPIPGLFYAPPTHIDEIDRDFPQRDVYVTPGFENFLWDTWVNVILSAPDSEGNYWTGPPGLAIPGRGDYPVATPGHAIMPRTSDNPSANGGADLARYTIDITWGDLEVSSRTYPVPGTYTVARLTFDSLASGDWILGHMFSSQNQNADYHYAFQIPNVPEPASIACLASAPLCLRRPRKIR